MRRYVSYYSLIWSLLLNVVKSFDLVVYWKCKLFFRNLSMNKFDGPIDPASIFNPSSNLKVLDLSRNNFSGSLPDISLFSTSLQQLWVHIACSSLVIWSWYFNRVCMKTTNYCINMKPKFLTDLSSCVTLGIWVTMGSIHHKFLLGFLDSINYKHCKYMLFPSLFVFYEYDELTLMTNDFFYSMYLKTSPTRSNSNY